MALILRKETPNIKRYKLKKEYKNLLMTIDALPGVHVQSTTLDKPFEKMKKGWNGLLIFLHIEECTQEGLFFLTRSVDRRYWEYGDRWKIQLSVGDTIYENGDRPIVYQIFRPFLDGDTEEIILSECEDLIENLAYHFNHDGFMIGYDMDKTKYKQSRLHWTKEAWDRETQLNDLGI